MLEETHFSKAEFLITGNILKMACKEQVTHSYPAVVALPSGVRLMIIFFLVLPLNLF